jgi:eukaryotic-like serine/threonine-protein kinase
MSQTFIRCPHCGLPHPEQETRCSVTGELIVRKRSDNPNAQQRKPPTFVPPPLPKVPPALTPPSIPPKPVIRELVGSELDGKYVIQAILGRGGMATVYDAFEKHNERPVAIKVLPFSKINNREATTRFLNEAKAAASLSHPNICQIYHFGSIPDGRPYYAMERLVGESLSSRIEKHGALPFIDATEIVMQILGALKLAHRNGIIHRDIKPENVFLHHANSERPMVKLLDFGLSKDISPNATTSPIPTNTEDTTQLTRAGFVMGTPYYLAPEQALGARDFDGRVDLWATGVVLYETLTGQRPFSGSNYQILVNKIVTEREAPLRKIRPNSPKQFQRIFDKALAKKREDRYESADDFFRELQALRILLLKRERQEKE